VGGVGGWGLGDWAQPPIPNPQSPIPNPQKFLFSNINIYKIILNDILIIYLIKICN